MANKWKFRLSGTGGQGVIKAAVVLAESALLDGQNASQSQVYGPESRGSATRAEVQISDHEIRFPKVIAPNVLLCLSQQAYDKFIDDLQPGGTLIVDDHVELKSAHDDITVHVHPIVNLTRDKLGSELAVNIVALGVMNQITQAVSDTAMEESLHRNFKPTAAAWNIEAYYVGKESIIE